MLKIALAVSALFVGLQTAQASERTAVVRCENWDNSLLTIVEVLREVVDAGTPHERFQDYLVGGVSMIDPGGVLPWFYNQVESQNVTRTHNTFNSADASLAVEWQGETRQVDPSGVFVLSSKGLLTTTKDGQTSALKMDCHTTIVM